MKHLQIGTARAFSDRIRRPDTAKKKSFLHIILSIFERASRGGLKSLSAPETQCGALQKRAAG